MKEEVEVIDVDLTRTAEGPLRALRGRRAQAARLALEALMQRGCEAAGYRLAGADLKHVCCRHLYGNDRMLITWPIATKAVVLAVGPHDRSAGNC